MKPYAVEIEQMMQQFYTTLSEKDRRRYAAIEAKKLGHGGVTYIARVLGCDRSTVQAGMKELGHLPEKGEMARRIRKPGGGRKPYYETYPDIDEQFLAVLRDHTAGDPMREDVRWTNLTPGEIADHLEEQYQVKVSRTVIRKLLKKHNYRRRKGQKNEP
jgi:predicted transcriptional regulator